MLNLRVKSKLHCYTKRDYEREKNVLMNLNFEWWKLFFSHISNIDDSDYIIVPNDIAGGKIFFLNRIGISKNNGVFSWCHNFLVIVHTENVELLSCFYSKGAEYESILNHRIYSVLFTSQSSKYVTVSTECSLKLAYVTRSGCGVTRKDDPLPLRSYNNDVNSLEYFISNKKDVWEITFTFITSSSLVSSPTNITRIFFVNQSTPNASSNISKAAWPTFIVHNLFLRWIRFDWVISAVKRHHLNVFSSNLLTKQPAV